MGGGEGERLLDKRRLFERGRQLDHLRQWKKPFCIAEGMREKRRREERWWIAKSCDWHNWRTEILQ